MNAADTLERAADAIDRVGWWDGNGIPKQRPCAMIAISWVGAYYLDAVHELERVVGNIAQWNDGSDAATVTSTMRAVAATLRAQSNTEPVPVYEEA